MNENKVEKTSEKVEKTPEELFTERSKLFEDKTAVALNLIRTNSTADDVLKITQGIRNLVDAHNAFLIQREAKPKKPGASAS